MLSDFFSHKFSWHHVAAVNSVLHIYFPYLNSVAEWSPIAHPSCRDPVARSPVVRVKDQAKEELSQQRSWPFLQWGRNWMEEDIHDRDLITILLLLADFIQLPKSSCVSMYVYLVAALIINAHYPSLCSFQSSWWLCLATYFKAFP